MKKVDYELTYKQVKNINLRVTSEGMVKVSAPYGVSKIEIDKFVDSKTDFINKYLEKFSSRKIQSVFEKNHIYLYGKKHVFKKVQDSRFSYSIKGDVVTIFYKNLEKDYERMLKLLASDYFNFLGQEVSCEMKLKNIFIDVKKFKTCFGKNYGKTRIALNYLLVHLDAKYVKHVLYHEYAHCKEMNHSKKFYKILCAYDSEYIKNKNFINNNLWKFC